jgi:hypothetical protein
MHGRARRPQCPSAGRLIDFTSTCMSALKHGASSCLAILLDLETVNRFASVLVLDQCFTEVLIHEGLKTAHYRQGYKACIRS